MRIDAAGYLQRLEAGLAAGAALLPRGFLETHGRYVESRMLGADAGRCEGAFTGRRGGADIYYTAFGLRAADLLGIESRGFWSRAAGFLERRGTDTDGIVECFSLLAAARFTERRAPGALSGRFRRALEGAAEARLAAVAGAPAGGGGISATEIPAPVPGRLYADFLAMLSWGMLGRPMPEGDAVVELARGRRRPDGGFSDADAARSGMSQTAAAVSVLSASNAMPVEHVPGTREFIVSMQRPDGGFAAHAAAPVSDLLSTFTGLVAAGEMRCLDRLRQGDLGRFVRSLECAGGGFRGAPTGGEPDVEYTYYGAAAFALLSGVAAGALRKPAIP